MTILLVLHRTLWWYAQQFEKKVTEVGMAGSGNGIKGSEAGGWGLTEVLGSTTTSRWLG